MTLSATTSEPSSAPMSPDPALNDAIRAVIDGKTKPLGALGRIETLAAHLARLQGTTAPRMERCTLTIFAADHGIAAEGVSAFPQEVTVQMALNFLNSLSLIFKLEAKQLTPKLAPTRLPTALQLRAV